MWKTFLWWTLKYISPSQGRHYPRVAEHSDKCKRCWSLTGFQRDNLEYIEVKENFKFGPSGPFKCIRKLRIPIKKEPKPLLAEVASVQADIPMLLGNNIFKPLGAKFKLFPEGDGFLKLQDVWISMFILANPKLSKPKLNHQLNSTEFEVRLHSTPPTTPPTQTLCCCC